MYFNMNLATTAFKLLNEIEDPGVIEGVEAGGGSKILLAIGIFVILGLYTSVITKAVRPGLASVFFTMFSIFVSLMNPYLSAVSAISAILLAILELYFTSYFKYKEKKGTLSTVLAIMSLPFSLFFGGMWLMFSIREIMEINIYQENPDTGEVTIGANWMGYYFLGWFIAAVIFMIYVFIREYGIKKTVTTPLKFVLIGDWTLAFDDNGIIASLRKYNIVKITVNVVLRCFVLFIIGLVIVEAVS